MRLLHLVLRPVTVVVCHGQRHRLLGKTFKIGEILGDVLLQFGAARVIVGVAIMLLDQLIQVCGVLPTRWGVTLARGNPVIVVARDQEVAGGVLVSGDTHIESLLPCRPHQVFAECPHLGIVVGFLADLTRWHRRLGHDRRGFRGCGS